MSARQPLRANKSRQIVAKSGVVQAPTGGWDASSPLAAMEADRAVQLLNWFPQPGYVEVRRGHDYHAWDCGTDTTPVETMMVWQGPASSKLFAAASDTIYDVTLEGQASSSLGSLSDAAWQWVSFTNSGNTYLYIVNGIDAPRHFDGSSWATPAITGATEENFIHINVHKKRIWFVEKDSLNAWYLATDAIAGGVTQFPLGAVFTKGGHLMAMATWTRDGGSGSDDYAVFVSSRGQIALYAGTDPANASTWSLVGVFDAPAPIGRRCFARWGADVILITVEGVYPLSQVLSVDQSQARGVAITRNIQNAFVQAARSYRTNWGWEACVYSKGTMLIVNVPVNEFGSQDQYVMNTLTGAWCQFDGMGANSWVVYEDNLYFGGNDGAVYQADTGAADVATPITAIGQSAYSAFSNAGRLKRFTMMQPLVTSSDANRPALGISTDFIETSEMSQSSVTATSGIALFDQAEWDNAVFAGSVQSYNDWVSIPALGRFASVKFQAQTGIEGQGSDGSYWGIDTWGDALWGGTSFASDETMQINGFVVLYEPGDYV